MSTDPTPLANDASTPEALRKALGEAHAGAMPPELLASILQATIPPPSPPPAGKLVVLLKFAGPIAAVGVLGLGLALRTPAPLAQSPPAASTPSAASEAQTPPV